MHVIGAPWRCTHSSPGQDHPREGAESRIPSAWWPPSESTHTAPLNIRMLDPEVVLRHPGLKLLPSGLHSTFRYPCGHASCQLWKTESLWGRNRGQMRRYRRERGRP